MSSSPGARRSPTSLVGLLLLVAIIASEAPSPGGQRWRRPDRGEPLPADRGDRAGRQDPDLYDIVFLIAAAIFFLVEGLIVWTVIRYRRRPRDVELPPQTHGNAIAEIVWTVVPTIIVAFMFVISWQTLNEVDTPVAPIRTSRSARSPASSSGSSTTCPPTTTLSQALPARPRSTSSSCRPAQDGGLTVPTGRTVQLYLTSPDVIHAFYVPQFLFKRDVVPGRVNQFDFKVEDVQAGQTFRGQCAELCGSGHRLMLFDVHALTRRRLRCVARRQGRRSRARRPASAPPSAPAESGAPSGDPSGDDGRGRREERHRLRDQPTLTAPANSPITIEFDNQDVVPHNVKLFKDAIGGETVYDGEIFTGPAHRDRTRSARSRPGTYPFVCAVHPNMTGTLTVQ